MEIKNDKYSVKFYPTDIVRWTQTGNNLHFYSTDTELEVILYTDKIIRFRYAPGGVFQRDFSYAINEGVKPQTVNMSVYEDRHKFDIMTEHLVIQIYKKNMKVTILDRKYNVINEDELGFHWQHYIKKGGKINYCSKKIQDGETFYGMGDKPTELNLRGKRFENYGADTYGFKKDQDPIYKNIPFYMGLHHDIGYGIFFDNTFRTIFDFGKEQFDVCSFWARGGEMNYYFIYGPDLTSVTEQYSWLTGTPEMPPLWALGYHQCKWSYYPESQVREIAQEFRDRGIPCDGIYLDIDYMEGFRCFTWSKEGFPKPSKLLGDLAEKGFKTIIIIDPGIKIDPEYWVYQEGLKNGYFCKRADGELMEGDVWPGACNFPDYTNPEVRRWWAGLFEELIRNGVRGVWNDMNEPAVFEIGTFPEDVRHDYDGDPCSHRKAHNVYGMQMARATNEGIKKFLYPNRPFVITRSCYSGAQRYSSVWTGDNIATWEHMWIANMQVQRLCMSGISFAGSDIGGFIGNPDGELFVRWIQMAVFHPFCRAHSAGNDPGAEPQEPWSYGQKYEFIAKKFIQLRYQLLPYIYTTFWQHSQFGTPMVRPLVMSDQNDTESLYRTDQYMFGDKILVCPVNLPGADTRLCYLPKGRWYNFWDDSLETGGKEINANAPIEKMPLFVKEGSVIPNYPKMQYVGEIPVTELTLHIYFTKTVQSSYIYEDAGDYYGYRNGQFNVKKFVVTYKKNVFKIFQTISGSFEATYKHYKIVMHGVPDNISEFEVDGKTYKITKRNTLLGVVKFKTTAHFKEITLKV